jgi:hypothetical protein
MHHNGDGLITDAARCRRRHSQRLNAIIATLGSDTDRSGLPGVDETAHPRRFLTRATALLAWHDAGSGRRGRARARRKHQSRPPPSFRAAARQESTTSSPAPGWPLSTPVAAALLNPTDSGLRRAEPREMLEQLARSEIAALPLAQVSADAHCPRSPPASTRPGRRSIAALRNARHHAGARRAFENLTHADWENHLRNLRRARARGRAANPSDRAGPRSTAIDTCAHTTPPPNAANACSRSLPPTKRCRAGSRRGCHARQVAAPIAVTCCPSPTTSFPSATSIPAATPFVPGRCALSRRPHLRPHRESPRCGASHAALATLSGVCLVYCDCVAQRRENADRRRLHRRRFRPADGRPQRRLLRPPGPRLGCHHHQDRRPPDQPAPGLLVALQEARAHGRRAVAENRREQGRAVEGKLAEAATAR